MRWRCASSKTSLGTPTVRRNSHTHKKMIKYIYLIHCTSVSCWKMAWIQSPPIFSPEKKIQPKNHKQLCHRVYPLWHQITQREQRQLPMFSPEGGGKSSFWKEQYPYSHLQPFPACSRCPAAGVSKRKLNRRRAVKCNVLAMPKEHGLCQDQLGTAVGQPKICYNPELSRARTPDI